MTTHYRRSAGAAAAVLAAVTGLGLAGCGAEEPPADAPAEASADAPAAAVAFAGPYDQAFVDEQVTYVDEEITLSAEVETVLDDDGFVLDGPGTESLLVVYDMDLTDIEEGRTVEVTGALEQAFDLPTVEEDVQQDLENELFEDYDQQPFLVATDVTALPDD